MLFFNAIKKLSINSLSFLFSFTLWQGVTVAFHQFIHVLLLEYLPFIILLLSLYTISGGIRLKGRLSGAPKSNVLLILIGTILASWMGTTGAAMLLIRPLITANECRKNRTHLIVFFIFLVSNIGGSLSPIGDPPLFLGFLRGVDFIWPLKNLYSPMLLISSILLVIFFILDTYYYKNEAPKKKYSSEYEPISI